jgi:hypothetical protein
MGLDIAVSQRRRLENKSDIQAISYLRSKKLSARITINDIS